MLRWMIGLLLTLVLAVGVAGQDDLTCTPPSGEPITLGAVFPAGLLVPDLRETGRGILAMADALNACGGIAGRPVELVTRTADSYDTAVEAATELYTEVGVPLIIGSGSPLVHDGLRQVAEAESRLLWEVTEAIQPGGAWTFSPRPTQDQIALGLVDFLDTELLPTLAIEEPRVAVFYSTRSNASQSNIDAFLSAYREHIIYRAEIPDDSLYDANDLVRDLDANIVVSALLSEDNARLWNALRFEDANPQAYIYIGTRGIQRDLCQRLGRNEYIITVRAAGAVRQDDPAVAEIQAAYHRAYIRLYNNETTVTADLAAAGVQTLAAVLAEADDPLTAETLRGTIRAYAGETPLLMGYSFQADESGVNTEAEPVVEQRQGRRFCSLWPTGAASCNLPVQPFPTWRERALSTSPVCVDDNPA